MVLVLLFLFLFLYLYHRHVMRSMISVIELVAFYEFLFLVLFLWIIYYLLVAL